MALDTNLVSYWKLDESSGNAADSVGGVTLTNTNTVTYAAGKINNGSVHTNAGVKYLTASNNLGITNGNITVSMWFKASADIGAGTWGLFQKSCGSAAYIAYVIGYDYNEGTRQLFFNRQQADVSNNRLNTSATLGTTWHHIVLTYNGTNLSGYLDGVALGNLACSGDGSGTATNLTQIGYSFDYSPYTPDATIDEVGVWSRVLTANEVAELYNANRALVYPLTVDLTTSLQSYWKLDETSGTRYDATALAPILSATPNDLTDNNSVLYGSGADAKIVNSAFMVAANSEYLSLANAETKGLEPNNSSYSFFCWIKGVPGTGVDSGIIDVSGGAQDGFIFFLYNVDGSTFRFQSANRKGAWGYNIWDWTSFPDNNTWYHIGIVYDNSAKTIQYYLQGAPAGSPISNTFGVQTGAGAVFVLGTERAYNPMGFRDGFMDEAGYWSRVLSATEVTTLYAAGAGLTYPFTGTTYHFSPFPSHYNT